jgi:hypothetical protein
VVAVVPAKLGAPVVRPPGVPALGVHFGRQAIEQQRLRNYREAEEQAQRDVAPWQRSYTEVLKSGLGLAQMTSGELLTKLAFFARKLLRRIAQQNRECVG